MSNPAGSRPPPEGLLLEQARKRMDISQNEAGARADVSGTRWRQVVNEQASEMTSTRGVKTLARMAVVVGVTADQFAAIGRDDIAEALREPRGEPTVAALAERLERLEKEAEERREETNELRKLLREITGKDAGTSGGEEPGSNAPRQAM